MPASSVARLAPALADSPFRVVQVEALGDDATVVIVRDGDALIPASCVSSYATKERRPAACFLVAHPLGC